MTTNAVRLSLAGHSTTEIVEAYRDDAANQHRAAEAPMPTTRHNRCAAQNPHPQEANPDHLLTPKPISPKRETPLGGVRRVAILTKIESLFQ